MTESRLDDILPDLIERSLQRCGCLTIQFVTEKRCDAIDTLLWTFSEDSFLAHGTSWDDWPDEQNVLLTTSFHNLNASRERFCLEGAHCPDPDSYERFFIFFDGQIVDQLIRARKEWKNLKNKGYLMTYWQQTLDRRWEKKF
jgi:DNA polymerase-3 subunit chi